MVSVQIFVEGGAEGVSGQIQCRQAFSEFFKHALPDCRQMRITPSRTGANTIDRFITAFQKKTSDVVLLLVDSDDPMPEGMAAYDYLVKVKGHKIPIGARQNCFLMVQCMEAWFVAHKDALAEYFGKGFKADNIPDPRDPNEQSRPDVEQILKDEVLRSLKNATRHSEKGEYHKVRHGLDRDLWSKLDPEVVRHASRSCDQLIMRLHKLLC